MLDPGFEYPPEPIINYEEKDSDDRGGDEGSKDKKHDKSEKGKRQLELREMLLFTELLRTEFFAHLPHFLMAVFLFHRKKKLTSPEM